MKKASSLTAQREEKVLTMVGFDLRLGYSAAEYSYIRENLYIRPKFGDRIPSNCYPKFVFDQIRGPNFTWINSFFDLKTNLTEFYDLNVELYLIMFGKIRSNVQIYNTLNQI